MGRKAELVADRFWRHVRRNANDKGCHLWEGATNRSGRGVIGRSVLEGGGNALVHHLAYEMELGKIPEGQEVVQVCQELLCVRLDHLDAMGFAEAQEHRWSIQNGHKAQCPKGHPYEEENVYRYRGARYCRTCRGMRLSVSS